MYILDTDTISHLHRGNENVKRRLAQAADFEFAITIVTKAEILRGRIEFLLKAEDGKALEIAQKFFIESENLLEQIPLVKFDSNSIAKFDELKTNSKFRKIGQKRFADCKYLFGKQRNFSYTKYETFQTIPQSKLLKIGLIKL